MSASPSRTAPQAPSPLYMLAFDHRQVLRDLYPGASEDVLVTLKGTVLDALLSVSDSVGSSRSLAYLVDEEYGAAAARRAHEHGIYVAMPIEASRTKILQLQFPDDYRNRFTQLDPQCVKALVFHNPADDPERKRQQLGLLRTIGEFAGEQGRDYLLEILITPTQEQLQQCEGDVNVFRTKLFPRLLVDSLSEMQDFGIDPDLWKIEGLETVNDAVALGAQATTNGRDSVRCIVLGSGESQAKVNAWLQTASSVETFSGFAIGRTVWHQPLAAMIGGQASRDEAIEMMATTFTNLISSFGRESVAEPTGA